MFFSILYDAMGIIPTLREKSKQGADILMKIKPVIPFFMKTLPAFDRERLMYFRTYAALSYAAPASESLLMGKVK